MNPLFADVSKSLELERVYHLVSSGSGLPLPFAGPDEVTFWFTTITEAEEARAEVYSALEVLGREFGIGFERKPVTMSNGARYQYAAFLPSGLKVNVMARCEHIGGPAQPATADTGELVAA